MKGKIKLVFFDYGDILVSCPEKDFHAYAAPFLKKRGVNPADESRAWNKFKRRVSTGRITLRQAQEEAFKSLGKTKREARDWISHCERYHLTRKPYSGVVETLAELKRAGYKTAVLSDSVHSTAFKKKTIKGWGAKVDAVYCSCSLGCEKPDARAYRAVLRHFKLKPGEAVFVGHARDELEGAKRLGIPTIAFRPDKGARGDFETRDFRRIPALVARVEETFSLKPVRA